jgi:hypothetical protein
LTTTANFRPGFRISEIDVGVLLLGTIGSYILARIDESLGVLMVFTVAHFFLFCNVVRMDRPLELIWAALFVLLASSTMLIDVPTWSHTFTVVLTVTAIFVAVQVLMPSYHGAFWRQINPNLPQWWAINREDKE